ncbi:hypothetical protein OBBRIDRAFT_788523 [Obba rivulosa]|uniref:Uncharacterized protein n=1 Tax=Obba rivulosa TaxID=1052685 RepID=A0A8E2J7N2_9APHY|nr:hypothetical protein OBBRIDRAFT_788523 [Obba rivulosa]
MFLRTSSLSLARVAARRAPPSAARAAFSTTGALRAADDSPLHAKNMQGTGPPPPYAPVGVNAALQAAPSTRAPVTPPRRAR